VKRPLLTTLLLSLLATGARAADNVPATPASGIDTQYIDANVRPQDDFFTYLNGKWLKTVDIPADRSSWGTFYQLRENTQAQLRDIAEADRKNLHAKAGSDERKVGDLYASFMDDKRRETLGYKPLSAELQRIRVLKDRKGVPALIAHLNRIGVATPYTISIGQDAKESTRYAVYVRQGGLGMPDRDYYLKADDAKLAATKATYQQHVAKTLALAGDKDVEAKAAAIVAFETALAQAQWTKVELRDPNKNYNKVELAALPALTPGYDLKAGLAEAGVASRVDYAIVGQPSYLQAFDKIVADADLDTLKAYFQWQLLRAYSPYLSKAFVNEDFDFYGRTLTGAAEIRAPWKIAVSTVEESLGEALGREYVAQHFPPERKARMEALVQNLLAAYRDSIGHLDWMGEDTKKQALDKLAKFSPKIGYPNKWRDYSRLAIKRDDLVGNVMRAQGFEYQRNVDKLGKPIDREEWSMTPQTVNAYYNSRMNGIVFPAAILQPPFFNMAADDAVNYGAIGAVIGHEIGHGFDDKGSQSDGDGNLRNWWTEQDLARFKAKTDMLVNQYGAFEPLPGYHVNGELTLGENIGDNAGLEIAHKAYLISLHGQPAPVIDGLTGDQRFYLGFAQVWRNKSRDAQQIVLIKTDPHSPGQFRANGTLRNQPAFYEAFGVKPGDKMYLPPDQRVSIW